MLLHQRTFMPSRRRHGRCNPMHECTICKDKTAKICFLGVTRNHSSCKHGICKSCYLAWDTPRVKKLRQPTCFRFATIPPHRFFGRNKEPKKNTPEFASLLYISLHTKPCPGCQAPIEKNVAEAHGTSAEEDVYFKNVLTTQPKKSIWILLSQCIHR